MNKTWKKNGRGKKKIVHSFKQGIPVHKVAILSIHYSWLNSHMWQRLAAKWVQNTWGFHGDIINLPLWTKQPNILLSSWRSEYIFNIGSMKDDRSLKTQKTKAEERSDAQSISWPSPSTALISWLAWWPCYEEESRDGCRWASSSRLVSESTERSKHSLEVLNATQAHVPVKPITLLFWRWTNIYPAQVQVLRKL